MDNQRDYPDECFKVDADTARAVDEYYEYSKIVGEDDGGKLFTPEQYEAYKARMKPIRTKNRIFLNWVNPKGLECESIGPQSLCFCKHRYIQHQTDFVKLPCSNEIKLPCKHCRCVSFEIMPRIGAQEARCECRHVVSDHSVKWPHFCELKTCEGKRNPVCNGFKCKVRCDCNHFYFEHKMLAETVQERLAKKKAVGKPTLYQAMGGLTGFTSLAPGIVREYVECNMTEEELAKPIGSDDHPYLKSFRNDNCPSYSKKINDSNGPALVWYPTDVYSRLRGETDPDYKSRRINELRKCHEKQ